MYFAVCGICFASGKSSQAAIVIVDHAIRLLKGSTLLETLTLLEINEDEPSGTSPTQEGAIRCRVGQARRS